MSNISTPTFSEMHEADAWLNGGIEADVQRGSVEVELSASRSSLADTTKPAEHHVTGALRPVTSEPTNLQEMVSANLAGVSRSASLGPVLTSRAAVSELASGFGPAHLDSVGA